MSNETTNDGWRYAEVEIMGHRSHLGRAREVDLLGARYLEVEDMTGSGNPFTTSYPERSIFSVAWLSDEEGKRRVEEMQEEHGTAPEEQKRVRVRAIIDRAVQGEVLTRDVLHLCVLSSLLWCDSAFVDSVIDGMVSSGDLEEYPGIDGGERRYAEGMPF